MKIPERVKTELFNICKKNNGVKVDIISEKTGRISGLEFDDEGRAKIINKNIYIHGYIERHVNFSRKPIQIKVNGIDLREIDIKLLEHKNEQE